MNLCLQYHTYPVFRMNSYRVYLSMEAGLHLGVQQGFFHYNLQIPVLSLSLSLTHARTHAHTHNMHTYSLTKNFILQSLFSCSTCMLTRCVTDSAVEEYDA